jgi:hypothetical protein
MRAKWIWVTDSDPRLAAHKSSFSATYSHGCTKVRRSESLHPNSTDMSDLWTLDAFRRSVHTQPNPLMLERLWLTVIPVS